MDYKFGRQIPKGAPALYLGQVLSGVVPEHPPAWDFVLETMNDWQMLDNDKVGNCVAVTWANCVRVVTTLLNGNEVYPTLEQVMTLYKTQNPLFPAQDNGMDIQTMLEHLHRNGGPDGRKPVAFAKVHPYDKEEMKAAIAIFGAVIFGIVVKRGNMEDFDAGIPWQEHRDSPMIGRHAVMTSGYLGALEGDFHFVTWGKETLLTDQFVNGGLVEEAWVVVWPENLGTKQFQEGMNIDALASAYTALTGRPLPIPYPTPSPEPTAPGCILGTALSLFRRKE